MNAFKSRIIAVLPTINPECNSIRISLAYYAFGAKVNGVKHPRGFYLVGENLNIENGITTFGHIGNVCERIFIKDTERFSTKFLQEFDPAPQDIAVLTDTVLRRTNLSLKPASNEYAIGNLRNSLASLGATLFMLKSVGPDDDLTEIIEAFDTSLNTLENTINTIRK